MIEGSLLRLLVSSCCRCVMVQPHMNANIYRKYLSNIIVTFIQYTHSFWWELDE